MIIISIRIIFGIQRHRIVSARVERMTFQNALDGHIAAFQRTMLLDGFNAVVAACRIEPA